MVLQNGGTNSVIPICHFTIFMDSTIVVATTFSLGREYRYTNECTLHPVNDDSYTTMCSHVPNIQNCVLKKIGDWVSIKNERENKIDTQSSFKKIFSPKHFLSSKLTSL